VHAGRGLLRQAAHLGHEIGVLVVHHLGQIAAVVEQHVRPPAVRPQDRLVDAPPVLLLGLALPGVDRHAACRDGRRRLILGREDVARRPTHLGAELQQGLDQNRRLDRHVQAAGDARALERLRRPVFPAQRHQAGHLGLGDGDLLAAPIGQRDVGNLVVGEVGHRRAPSIATI
jgi:hypothetical protein